MLALSEQEDRDTCAAFPSAGSSPHYIDNPKPLQVPLRLKLQTCIDFDRWSSVACLEKLAVATVASRLESLEDEHLGGYTKAFP